MEDHKVYAAFTTDSGKKAPDEGLSKAEVLEGEMDYSECAFKGTESSKYEIQLKWTSTISPGS